MQAGGVFELIMGISTPQKYAQAVKSVRQRFQKRMEGLLGFDTSTFDDSVTQALLLRRRLIRLIRRTQNLQEFGARQLEMLASFQRQGMLNPGQSLVGVLSAAMQPELLDLLEDMGRDTAMTLPARDLLISVFWARPHEPAAALLMDPVRQWQTLIDFREYGLAVCGLHLLTPLVRSVHLHSSPFAAGCANAQWSRQSLDCASVSFTLGALERVPFDDSDVVLHWDDGMLLPRAGRLTELIPSLHFCADSSKRVTYPQLLFGALTPHIKGGALTRAGLKLLGQANPSEEVKAQLVDLCHAAHAAHAAQQLVDETYNVLVASSEKTDVYQTPSGYLIKRGKHSDMVSNFVLKPSFYVSFGKHHTPHMEVNVRIGSQAFATLIPPRLLDAPKELVDVISLRAAARGLQVASPVVRDNKAFLMATGAIKTRAGQLPVKIGLPFVGWAFDGSQFFAPGLRVCADTGTHAVHMPAPPEASLFDNFSMQPQPEFDRRLNELHADERRMLLLVMGAVLRAHRNEPHHVVRYKHDSRSVALFESVFRGLGQLRPAQAAQVTQDFVHGYPVWVQNARSDQKSRLAAFSLSPTGSPVTTERPHAELSGVVRSYIRRLVELCMSMPDITWETPRGVTYETTLIAEASDFVSRHMGETLPAERSRYMWLEHVLGSFKHSNLERVLTYEFGTQRTAWNLGAFTRSDEDKISFEHEMRVLFGDVQIEGDLLWSPAAETIDMLSMYYGEQPKLTIPEPPQ